MDHNTTFVSISFLPVPTSMMPPRPPPVNMFVSGWVWSPAFIISPLFYHGPTTILHGLVALQEWREPKAKHGGADIIRSQ